MSTPSPFDQPTQPPLWVPHYGASLPEAVRRFWKKYAVFTGRASRSEYWWWMLVAGLVYLALIVCVVVASNPAPYGSAQPGLGAAPVGFVLVLWLLGTLVPNLALMSRRLHDANLSGWLILLNLIPWVGGVVFLVLMLLPPQYAGQRYDRPEVPRPEEL